MNGSLTMGQWVMGHSFDGSHGSWVTARDPFGALDGMADVSSPEFSSQILSLG